MTSFIPATNPAITDAVIENDGFYPDIALADIRASTGLSDVFTDERIKATTLDAMIEINASIIDWRNQQTAETLGNIPGVSYGQTSEKVHLYLTAVSCRVRALLNATTRDYDSTKSGHDRADALEASADNWMQRSNEALSRMTGRARTTVELI